MGTGRGWLAGDWPSTGGGLNITAAAWTAGFHWWRFGSKKRTQNVSEYVLVLAICLVIITIFIFYAGKAAIQNKVIADFVPGCYNTVLPPGE